MSNLKIIKLQYETLNETEKEEFINWINKKKVEENSKEMLRLARILNKQEEDERKQLKFKHFIHDFSKDKNHHCYQCNGSRRQYWSDDVTGVCLECCCINCKKLNKDCRCK